jgi:hypothetical protein
LEEVALNDPYFIERKLYPNVDFYSGIILRAMGIPLNMFTVMFAIGPDSGMDRALAGAAGDAREPDRPPPADLHGEPGHELRALRRPRLNRGRKAHWEGPSRVRSDPVTAQARPVGVQSFPAGRRTRDAGRITPRLGAHFCRWVALA